jgi:hypothetical protein
MNVIVTQEDTGYPEYGQNSKIEKYTPLLPFLAEKFHV